MRIFFFFLSMFACLFLAAQIFTVVQGLFFVTVLREALNKDIYLKGADKLPSLKGIFIVSFNGRLVGSSLPSLFRRNICLIHMASSS